ncbi:SET domain-containing protein [Coprinellus micaceus]|uniref:SET domain-containing protein n=1 Tax=Coprinellus micaceus TaxID=71717 RepID=A0A4Y7T176_COPMI|nr:SET domain-containing protein [Coprinellus micaceus]
MSGGTRQILSAHIAHNTREDEPNAPPIEILNKVDNDPAPPWEFWYTNQMYHGPGVPLPDGSKMKGCDCVGKCDPRSKTCQCVARQRVFFDGTDDHGLGFIYDKQRRLRPLLAGYAIWECNDLCGCDEDCMNRVVQRGRTVQVSIQKTENKGWGVFAGPKKIPRGTFLGVYAGEILNEEDSHVRGQVYEKWGRTYLFDIDFYYLERLEKKEPVYTVDAYHAGNFTRFLNHSCDPNAKLYACYINESYIAKPLLVVFSLRDIEPHEEICFSYTGIYPGEEDDDDRDAEAPAIKRAEWKKCYCGSANCCGEWIRCVLKLERG